MASPNLVIVDYGTGNLRSVRRVLDRLRANSKVSSDPSEVSCADKIILPGVGHFDTAMRNLNRTRVLDALHEAVRVRQKPVLGICLGMELMATNSDEGIEEGIGWLKARTVRLQTPVGSRFKVPHMGWNTLTPRKESPLLQGIDETDEFYFAHCYRVEPDDPSDILAVTNYGSTFACAIQRGNIFGVQYHPEKSHEAGARLLRNFVEM